ncbi:hypothetical protein AUJ16_02510 [Candidatus Micrarchaeota archaeon CG1_02_60_51]|nr:MAG: hypothetical protein AUJ16_02510 [Candidatus Micrarchaeota archaeon CG1_02_60_51]PIO02258.1 MAG: hypothetical protein COT58_01070 [Candidatus Micrarchaeota archaeon CG09_land_8_20_14_0_10_60_16]PIY91141.1 MAG: hypothetical protein COY71_04750 [Candidatus Micrarchaeota archaeon CG_4_10_14_0_8_um_filter_60_7]
MANRGKERLVVCEKCGRQVRRDKAVFIEKALFSNPLERKDIIQGQPYMRTVTREVCYCPSCGKHLRIYDKKKRMQERQRERMQMRPMGGFHRREGFGSEIQGEKPK